MFRIGTGMAVTLMGLWIAAAGLREDIVATIPGIVIVAVGVAILLNKREDEIEEIKSDSNQKEEIKSDSNQKTDHE